MKGSILSILAFFPDAHPQQRQPNSTSVYRQKPGRFKLGVCAPRLCGQQEQRVRTPGASFFKETWFKTARIYENHLSSLSQLMVKNLEFSAERINGDEGVGHSPWPIPETKSLRAPDPSLAARAIEPG
jgi:hypothetical protein